MSVTEQIKNILSESLAPIYLDIINESDMHRTHTAMQELTRTSSNLPLSETHLKLTIVSTHFQASPLVKRHQLVYSLLKPFINNPVHALTLNLFTPQEWEASHQS